MNSPNTPVRYDNRSSAPGWWRTPHGTPHSKANRKSSDSSPAPLMKPFWRLRLPKKSRLRLLRPCWLPGSWIWDCSWVGNSSTQRPCSNSLEDAWMELRMASIQSFSMGHGNLRWKTCILMVHMNNSAYIIKQRKYNA